MCVDAWGCVRWARLARAEGANLFLVGQCWMHELAVENAGALGVRGQQPYHKSNLELKVEGEPVGRTEVSAELEKEGFSNINPGQLPPLKWSGAMWFPGGKGVGARNAKLRLR